MVLVHLAGEAELTEVESSRHANVIRQRCCSDRGIKSPHSKQGKSLRTNSLVSRARSLSQRQLENTQAANAAAGLLGCEIRCIRAKVEPALNLAAVSVMKSCGEKNKLPQQPAQHGEGLAGRRFHVKRLLILRIADPQPLPPARRWTLTATLRTQPSTSGMKLNSNGEM